MLGASKLRIAVFDLDGTLIAGNSFHRWLVTLWLWAFWHGLWVICAHLMILFAARLFRLIEHRQLKKAVIKHSLQAPSAIIERFVVRLAQQVRPRLRDCILQHKQEGLTVVIVTAAPEVYLTGFAEACGADALLGTSSQLSGDWQENLGQCKWQSLCQYYYGQHIQLDVMYSDHSDDLPLLRRANRAVIVAPSSKQWQLLQESGVSCVLL